MLKVKTTYAEINPDTGMVEVIDMVTGEVVAIYGNPTRTLDITELDTMEVETDNGKVLVPKGLDLSGYRFHRRSFCGITADIICQRIVEGESLYRICKDPNMPSYSTVCKWKRNNSDFVEDLDQARVDRSEYYADQAIHEGMEITHKDDVPVATLKHNVMKWAAGVGDAGRYGTKTKIVGDVNAPVSFIIDTGIRRSGDEGYNIDESVETHKLIDATVKEIKSADEIDPKIKTADEIDSDNNLSLFGEDIDGSSEADIQNVSSSSPDSGSGDSPEVHDGHGDSGLVDVD